MKISQPKTARVINTARVLSEIRKTDSLSKAEISRILNINKVSIGEIVDNLIQQGLVRETGKIEVVNGRKPTCLELVKDSRFVLAVDIGRNNVTTALCDLAGKPVKIERVPLATKSTQEEFCVGLLKSAVRAVKLVDSAKILGVGITIDGIISEDGQTVIDSFLPWKNVELGQAFEKALGMKTVVVNSLVAYVSAEKITNPQILLLDKVMYLNWGHSISMAIVSNGKVVNTSFAFGHMKVANTGVCTCGEIGCLEAWCSSPSITKDYETRLGEAWDKISEDVLSYIAKALKTASKVVGTDKVIIGGEASTIVPDALKFLQDSCPNLTIEQSMLGERAEIQAASEVGLDSFFFLTTALDEMKEYI